GGGVQRGAFGKQSDGFATSPRLRRLSPIRDESPQPVLSGSIPETAGSVARRLSAPVRRICRVASYLYASTVLAGLAVLADVVALAAVKAVVVEVDAIATTERESRRARSRCGRMRRGNRQHRWNGDDDGQLLQQLPARVAWQWHRDGC